MPKIFDVELVFQQIPTLLKYLPITLEITIFSLFFGLILGLLLAVVKMKRIPVLYRLSVVFVSFMRGTPILLQLYITYYGIPIVLKYINYYYGTHFNVNNIPALVFVLLAFTLNESAYNSETIRAALQSVDKGQLEAAHSLGMSYSQVLRRIILPEAFEVALPTLGNSLIGMLKGTSLAFVCAVVEMTAEGKILAGYNYRFFEVYVSLSIIYWALTILIEQGIKLIENKISISDVKIDRKGSEQLDRN
jgi:amine acid ABC transporter, permease protein, 3-TM region, His/Glu/Gln/Arg/opine family